MQNTEKKSSFWQRLLFAKGMREKSYAHKIAYISVVTALNVVANFVELKFLDTQFSVTIVLGLLSGVALGPITGFASGLIGDALGVVLRGWLYMPWVGFSTATFALLSGVFVEFLPLHFTGGLQVRMALACVVSFLVCTILINSTGFYYYNNAMGFSTAVVDYASEHFGEGVTYWIYVAYRLFFKGQIWNSLVNYALFFIALPVLMRIKQLGIKTE
ncbi:MAG: ECF transporter S component [Clostridia bacterium]|nr:ECF transporter S component [Clostridia bacterium]